MFWPCTAFNKIPVKLQQGRREKYQSCSSTWAPPFQKNHCRNKARNELLEMEGIKPNKKTNSQKESG